jgi:predicted membrane channel-forming protein YqfA (hemolysin III family)
MTRPRVRSLMEAGGVLLIGAAILFLIPSQVEKPLGVESRTPPSFLPRVISVCLLLTGAGMLFRALLRPGPPRPVPLPREGLARIFLSSGLLALYALLFPRLGFVTSSVLAMGGFAYLFGARSRTKILLSLVLVPLGVWF